MEIAKLTGLSANSVINHTKLIFARYGIPETVVSDNGPQFSSEAYAQFAREYGFKRATSSPNHPQGNGEAERDVQTIKNLWKKGDLYSLIGISINPIRNRIQPLRVTDEQEIAYYSTHDWGAEKAQNSRLLRSSS